MNAVPIKILVSMQGTNTDALKSNSHIAFIEI